jgi:hypothetical protein
MNLAMQMQPIVEARAYGMRRSARSTALVAQRRRQDQAAEARHWRHGQISKRELHLHQPLSL